MKNLRKALEMACLSNNPEEIILGVSLFRSLPRSLTLLRTEDMAEKLLLFSDEIAYRRLLDLLLPIAPNLTAYFCRRQLDYPSPIIRLTAREYLLKVDEKTGTPLQWVVARFIELLLRPFRERHRTNTG